MRRPARAANFGMVFLTGACDFFLDFGILLQNYQAVSFIVKPIKDDRSSVSHQYKNLLNQIRKFCAPGVL